MRDDATLDDLDRDLAISRNTAMLDLSEEKPRRRVEDGKHLEQCLNY